MLYPLGGKVALVTGANQGIGQAVAIELGSRGASVILNVQDADHRPDATLFQLDQLGVLHEAYVADVSLEREVSGMVAAALARFGRIDVLVNNAGIFPRSLAIDLDEDVFDRTLRVNLKGAWLLSRAVAPSMIANRSGRIVNISSAAGFRGALRGAHYAASKAGLVALAKSLALELAPYGVAVNAVAPGIVDTAQPRGGMTEDEIAAAGHAIPFGRIATPDDVARAVAYLAGPESEYITGQTLHVNGGSLLV